MNRSRRTRHRCTFFRPPAAGGGGACGSLGGAMSLGGQRWDRLAAAAGGFRCCCEGQNRRRRDFIHQGLGFKTYLQQQSGVYHICMKECLHTWKQVPISARYQVLYFEVPFSADSSDRGRCSVVESDEHEKLKPHKQMLMFGSRRVPQQELSS